jgi:hypothetical protein
MREAILVDPFARQPIANGNRNCKVTMTLL